MTGVRGILTMMRTFVILPSFLCISWLYNLSVIPHLIGFALSMDDMTDLSLSRMTGVPGIVMRMMTMGTQGPTRVTRVTGTAL